jgi:hypothetical protein
MQHIVRGRWILVGERVGACLIDDKPLVAFALNGTSYDVVTCIDGVALPWAQKACAIIDRTISHEETYKLFNAIFTQYDPVVMITDAARVRDVTSTGPNAL